MIVAIIWLWVWFRYCALTYVGAWLGCIDAEVR